MILSSQLMRSRQLGSARARDGASSTIPNFNCIYLFQYPEKKSGFRCKLNSTLATERSSENGIYFSLLEKF